MNTRQSWFSGICGYQARQQTQRASGNGRICYRVSDLTANLSRQRPSPPRRGNLPPLPCDRICLRVHCFFDREGRQTAAQVAPAPKIRLSPAHVCGDSQSHQNGPPWNSGRLGQAGTQGNGAARRMKIAGHRESQHFLVGTWRSRISFWISDFGLWSGRIRRPDIQFWISTCGMRSDPTLKRVVIAGRERIHGEGEYCADRPGC
jgi:hypothetical protein